MNIDWYYVDDVGNDTVDVAVANSAGQDNAVADAVKNPAEQEGSEERGEENGTADSNQEQAKTFIKGDSLMEKETMVNVKFVT